MWLRVALSLMLANGVCAFATAADSYVIATAETQQIDEHSVCRDVTNNHASGSSLFVPTKTSGEWSSFTDNAPPGVSVVDCVVDPCAENPTIGTVCADGTVYAGHPMGNTSYPAFYADRCNIPRTWDGSACVGSEMLLRWSNTYTVSTPGTTDQYNGRANTDAMEAASLEDHPAAKRCRQKGPDWYLPSRYELQTLYQNRNIGGFADESLSGFYGWWSSTQSSASQAYELYSGSLSPYSKSTADMVRCVRRPL